MSVRLIAAVVADDAAPSSATTATARKVFDGGRYWLDVADAMRKRGCAAEAREMYEGTFRRYPDMAYAGLRDRARVGLDALR